EFLSVASHELKTPLAAFRLHLELIDKGLSPESRAGVSDRLAGAARQVRRLHALLERLLDVSLITTAGSRFQRARRTWGRWCWTRWPTSGTSWRGRGRCWRSTRSAGCRAMWTRRGWGRW
ncbi:histidine kinase dimerization/phospho-acceptor domain-containing protein, partial [Pyxidicoccus sp. 3LFB2]